MYLRRLEIRHLRSLGSVLIEPAPTLNVLAGPNGSGKTSVLEGIHFLGSGRSFRSRHVREVITRGEPNLLVFGEVCSADAAVETLGIERGAASNRIRISGEEVRAASSLARILPVLLISPDSHRLLTDGARSRRRLIDWTMFHVEPSYLELYQRYRRALRQRGAELRQGSSRSAVAAWEREMSSAAGKIHGLRERYADEILRALRGPLARLLGDEAAVDYSPGWDTARQLEGILADAASRDAERGFAGAGPHRADLRLRVGGTPAQAVLSRGEAKLFTLGLQLAQVIYLTRRTGKRPVLLVDDLASELDRDSRSLFIDALQDTESQVFVTAVSEGLINVETWSQTKMFHVEQGIVKEMVQFSH